MLRYGLAAMAVLLGCGGAFAQAPMADLPPECRTPPVAPGDAAPARLDDAALVMAVKDCIAALPDFSGAMLIARDGEAIFSAAKGMADREAGTANTLETRFRVGSMNKMFTGVAILQLVQAGKVKLDAPVGDYLKDYPNAAFAQSATVHQLLTHTSGAGDIFGPQFEAHKGELKTLEDYVALYGARDGAFPPGERFSYANYGFILLGRIIEAVSGQSYYAYVEDHIFAPAGMSRTGFEPETVAVADRAVGYMKRGDGFVSAANTLPYRGTSAGGGYSTVGDMLAFARALTAHKLLDAEHAKMAMSAQSDLSPGDGYGFQEMKLGDVTVAGHAGGAPGMNGDLRILNDGVGVIVTLSNTSPPDLALELTRFAVLRMAP